MKKYSITSKYKAAVPRSQRRKNVEGRSVVAGYSAGGGSGVDRSYVDANFVTLATEQVVTAHKDFAAGISMYGIPWEYDVERDAWTIKGNVIITKGLATYSALKEDDVLSIFDGLPIDSRTIVWNNGVLEVNSDMVGGLDEDALKDYLDTNKYATQTWINEQKYATEKWIEDKKFVSEDALAEKYVTIDTEQEITGLKDFTGGFKVNSVPISYNAEKNAIVLPTNVIIEGGLATYSTFNNKNVISVYDGLPIDGTTIYWSVDANGDKILKAATGGGTGGGIDESQLEDYLTTNGYATQTWVTNKGYALQSSLTAVDNRLKSVETFFATDDNDSYVNKWAEIVTFLDAVEGDTLDSILSTKADTATKISAGTGLTGGGTLAANRTLSLATVGTAGTYTKVTTDSYGRVTSGTTLSASDIPSLSWSKITSGKPTSLSGYGITDAYTKTDADERFLPIGGIAERAKILAGSLTATSYLLFNSNELNHCNNGQTNNFWFGYRLPSGSARSTNRWIFSSSASTKLADGLILAGKMRLGNTSTNVPSPRYTLDVEGNARISGQLSTTTSSDRRLKENIRKADVGMYLRSLGGAFAFEYISEEVERDEFYRGTHVGFIYQNVKNSLLERMCIEREDGFGSLNYLHPDYLGLLGAAAISHEEEIKVLKRRIAKLEKMLNNNNIIE